MKIGKSKYSVSGIEWPTLALILASYLVWLLLATVDQNLNPFFWTLASAINVTLFMSITHEVLHGHPTRNDLLNRILISFPIGWSLPFERFRDTHLEHHSTGELTDPFDDPESWYIPKNTWLSQSSLFKSALKFNNTLFGRMLIGPAIGLGAFYKCEIRTFVTKPKQRTYLIAVWLVHILLCAAMIVFISAFSLVSVWQWVLSIYLGHSILLVRTYLEHQATPQHTERTVIIENACPIAFLFLFNNYHFIHHDQPGIPWYRLPSEYKSNREHYLEKNGHYFYQSYLEVFRKYFFVAKEPVPHPFLRVER